MSVHTFPLPPSSLAPSLISLPLHYPVPTSIIFCLTPSQLLPLPTGLLPPPPVRLPRTPLASQRPNSPLLYRETSQRPTSLLRSTRSLMTSRRTTLDTSLVSRTDKTEPGMEGNQADHRASRTSPAIQMGTPPQDFLMYVRKRYPLPGCVARAFGVADFPPFSPFSVSQAHRLWICRHLGQCALYRCVADLVGFTDARPRFSASHTGALASVHRLRQPPGPRHQDQLDLQGVQLSFPGPSTYVSSQFAVCVPKEPRRFQPLASQVTYGSGSVAGMIVQDVVSIAGNSVTQSLGVALQESVEFSGAGTQFDGLVG